MISIVVLYCICDNGMDVGSARGIVDTTLAAGYSLERKVDDSSLRPKGHIKTIHCPKEEKG